MSPWERAHKFVTFVSPSPEKGLAIFVTLARRMADVAFAAVVTQWTGADTLAVLTKLPNVTVLNAHPDVDVIFRQTKVLLAPSLWQECCPLIVMEACLRGVPCVSSDVFGLPEANLDSALVVHAALSYDHARGKLHHGVSNAELEQSLGPSPPLPSAEERAASVRHSTLTEAATVDEAKPFEELLSRLLSDESFLREHAGVCRERFYSFAKAREHGLRRELESVAARRPTATPAAEQAWTEAVEFVRAKGVSVSHLTIADIQQTGGGGGSSSGDDPTADGASVAVDGTLAADDIAGGERLQVLPAPVGYKVVHEPYVFVRRAPATDAEILNALPTGTRFEVDVLRRGWVRTARAMRPLQGGPLRRGWALVDGASVGLGALLQSQ